MRTYTDRDLRTLVARSSVSSPPGHHVPLDFGGANLEMANLPYTDFRGANLEGANLRGAMLWGAVLDNACLDDADLTCADLTWCDLCGCSMQRTRLIAADLDEALLDWAALSDAVTARANMMTVNFTATPTIEEIVRMGDADVVRDDAVHSTREQSAPPSLRNPTNPAYKRYRFEQGRTRVLSDVDLHELLRWSASTGKPLNLRGCNLFGSVLRNASLRGACLAFSNATGAELDGVDLTGADLEGAWGWELP